MLCCCATPDSLARRVTGKGQESSGETESPSGRAKETSEDMEANGILDVAPAGALSRQTVAVHSHRRSTSLTSSVPIEPSSEPAASSKEHFQDLCSTKFQMRTR